MKKILLTLTVIFSLTNISFSQANSQGKEGAKYYIADWESLKNYKVPEWYYDAKFGIWTHWGAYSVPAFRGTHAGEWYPRWMYLKESEEKPYSSYEMQGAATAKHHVETYGDPSEYGYHDFIPQFKAEKWNPDEWAQLAIDCGAKFFTITGMHHDGFALYNSEYTEWNSVNMGPKRDLVGDLAEAVRKKGLKFGISNHFAHNRNYYQFYFNNGFDKAYKDRPELQGLYSKGVLDDEYIERWWKITTEMVRKYNPDLYYFDWCWNGSFWDNERIEFINYYYNHAIRTGQGTFGDPNVVLNYKNNSIEAGCAVLDLERASMSQSQNFVWQTDTSISDHSWGYSTEDTFKSSSQLIRALVDMVSKNGVMMLNFGPRADGTVPEECREALLGMGKWLKKNGEAIYATRPVDISSEGPTNPIEMENYGAKDIRYTRNKENTKIFVTNFDLPKGKLILYSTNVTKVAPDAKVTMLSNEMDIPFEVDKNGRLVLDLSKVNEKNAETEYAYSYAIQGFEIKNSPATSIELSEIYLEDMKDIDPLPEKYKADFPYLSAIEALYNRAHNGVKRDVNYHGREIMIGGKKYDKGLMVCPFGDFGRGIFVIKTTKLPKIKGFTAEIGIDDAVSNAGNSAFIIDACVGGKWKEIYKSDILTSNDNAVKVDVKIPSNTKYIRFVTTDGGNGCGADHAVWADAKFY